MKIVKLTAENVKKLRAVEITPTGELVEITGRNGQGKTSVLDSIWWALAGTKHIQAVPIRKGATSARIRLEMGELTVERRFTPTGSTLIVESADGARYTSPQRMLDALLGALTFDPLAFVGQEPRAQFETLRGIVPLEIDVEKLDGLNRRDHDKRAELNRDARAKRAQADGIAALDGLPEAPLDTAALMDRITSAGTVNAAIESERGRRRQAESDIATTRRMAARERARATELRDQADTLDQRASSLDGEADTQQAAVEQAEALAEPVDSTALRRGLEAAQTTNRAIEQRDRQRTLVEEAVALEREARELTATMEARAATKAEAIAAAAMPVESLGFGDGIVTFAGVPFDQASTAEQLKVSVAIAMAANPKLRVIRIKEGSSLDDENLALIAEMARANDYQVWVERIYSSDPAKVVIEDGLVVGGSA